MRSLQAVTVSGEAVTELFNTWMLYKVGVSIATGKEKEDLKRTLVGVELAAKAFDLLEPFKLAYQDIEEQAGGSIKERICPCCRDKAEKLKENKEYNGRY